MPIYGKPMTEEQIATQLSDPQQLEQMSWALNDWGNLTIWLDSLGAPEKTEDDIWLTVIEKVQWVVENVDHERIKVR